MTKENKELLLKDLCARLPYGVKVQYDNGIYNIDYISALYEEIKLDIHDNYTIGISEIKPYLRPMSSMTKEEEKEFEKIFELELKVIEAPEGHTIVSAASSTFEIDFYNKHHFDYRGLIPMGLAIEVTKENNPYEA